MSDAFVNPIFGEREDPTPRAEPDATVDEETAGTGHVDVDAVLASLDGLDELPVGDHVAVFEQAHESLRRTLAGAGQDSPAAGRS